MARDGGALNVNFFTRCGAAGFRHAGQFRPPAAQPGTARDSAVEPWQPAHLIRPSSSFPNPTPNCPGAVVGPNTTRTADHNPLCSLFPGLTWADRTKRPGKLASHSPIKQRRLDFKAGFRWPVPEWPPTNSSWGVGVVCMPSVCLPGAALPVALGRLSYAAHGKSRPP
jgi:hypothetical protein